MRELFEATVSALVYSLLGERGRAATPDFAANQVTRHVLEHIAHAPDFLRPALFCATLVFDLSTLLKFRACFHQLHPAQRRLVIESWHRSHLGPCADLIRFYESMAVFCWQSASVERP